MERSNLKIIDTMRKENEGLHDNSDSDFLDNSNLIEDVEPTTQELHTFRASPNTIATIGQITIQAPDPVISQTTSRKDFYITSASVVP